MKNIRKENGIQDTMGSLFVMLFIFIMLLCYVGFSKSVSKKADCDNIAKKYLYRMESAGCLTSEDFENMTLDFDKINVSVQDIGSSRTRVPYGEEVVLHIRLTFPNPLLEFLDLSSLGISLKTQYDIEWEATAKW